MDPNPPELPADSAVLAHRPTLMGTRHMCVAGHYLAAHAGFSILEAGGNAVDAGVAAGIALGVLQSDIVNVAGVAPILIYLAERREVVSISGLGGWPRLASTEFFQREHGGRIPDGILRTVVPAAPAAWLLALERFGTKSFGEVADAAIRFARDGFPMHALMAHVLSSAGEKYARWESNRAVYHPGGRPPAVGELFRQSDLAGSLQHMVDQERAAAGGGRAAGLRAAHDAFYKGDIARTIVRFHEANGGLLRAGDLADFAPEVEAPVRYRWGRSEIFTCQPWCQGPTLLQALAILDGIDLRALGHNSAAYIHTVAEALKLAFADRHRYYGDPRFVDVPIATLLSKAYAAARRANIDPERAWPEMPPAGDVSGFAPSPRPEAAREPEAAYPRDTSYCCAVDRHGNAFSATPSDVSFDTQVIPGTGLCPSSRGSQSWAEAGHPSSVEPGKRPRLTPSPALALRDGKPMPFGTPGGDVQSQAMLQVFLNAEVFGLELQAAVEAPRFATWSFPDSFEPHPYDPGRLNLETRIDPAVADRLNALGHRVEWWPAFGWRAGAVCTLSDDREAGVISGAADPRRPCYAVGW